MRLSWPSPGPTFCSTGRFAVGTVCPGTAPPPLWVAAVDVAPPPPLDEPALAPPPAVGVGGVRGAPPPAAGGAAAAAAPGGQDRRGRDSDRYRHRASAPAGSLNSHVPSPEGIVNACSGRQASRTWWPWLSPSPAEGTSVFCRLTTSSPPPSRSTT